MVLCAIMNMKVYLRTTFRDMRKLSFSALLALFAVVALMFVGCVIEELPEDIDTPTEGGGGGWTEETVGGDKKPEDDKNGKGDKNDKNDKPHHDDDDDDDDEEDDD